MYPDVCPETPLQPTPTVPHTVSQRWAEFNWRGRGFKGVVLVEGGVSFMWAGFQRTLQIVNTLLRERTMYKQGQGNMGC